MIIVDAMFRRPRTLGIVCATGAVALGLVYMALAGAPLRYFAINFTALGIGLAMLALVSRAKCTGARWSSVAVVAAASMLLATVFLGSEADGVTRWISFGGFAIQPSLILLPVMIVVFARERNAVTVTCIAVAVAAMALQPDRAMAGVLVFSLAAMTIVYRDLHSAATLFMSVIGLAVTLARPDAMPAVPYVDQILYTSFDAGLGAGLAVISGLALLLVPPS